jgi:uncharacterized protein (DUF305 family)
LKSIVLLFTLTLFIGACAAEERAADNTAAVEPAPSDTFASDALTPGELATAGGDVATTTPYDAQFIDTMSAHHQMGIHMNQMQIDRGSDPKLKEMLRRSNQMMRKDIQEMKSWRDRWHTNVPVAENRQLPGGETMNMDMEHMRGMSGEALDRMIADMMSTHHQGAISMARDALQRAERPELKQKAQQIIDDQQKEIEELRKWREARQ